MAEAAGKSIVGRRDNNEDAFRVREELGLYLVADGMGGHAGGEVASRLAADAIVTFFERGETTRPTGDDAQIMKTRMASAIRLAVDAVELEAVGDLEEMGTTLAAVLLEEGRALIAHIGDSRVYRVRDGEIDCLTRDHSFFNEVENELEENELPEQFAAMITRCIAADANSEPDFRVEETTPDDVFFICSDGITDVLEDARIGELLKEHEDPEEAASALVTAAFDADSHDNITCVVVHVSPRRQSRTAA